MQKFSENIRWIFVLIIIGLFSSTNGLSQDIKESVHYHNYSIKDGLPSNETYDVFQDSKGFLWIGTDNGVVKYDGNEFVTYTTKDGLTDNTIFRIAEDYQGRIWFMTYSRKLCYYENNSFTPYQYNKQFVEATKNIFIGLTISDFYVDENKNISLLLVNFTSIKISSSGKVTINQTSSRSPTQQKYLNVESIPDLPFLIKNDKDKFSHFKKYIIETNTFEKIHFIYTDSLELMGTKFGLFILNSDSKKKSQIILSENSITGAIVDNEGGLWCSSLYNGIFYIPNSNLSLFNTSKSQNNHIHGILTQNDTITFCYGKWDNYYLFNSETNKMTVNNTQIKYDCFQKEKIIKGIKFENPIFIKNVYMSVTSVVQLNSNKFLFACDKKGITIVDEIDDKFIPYYENLDLNSFLLSRDHLGNKWFFDVKNNNMISENGISFINRRIKSPIPKTLKLFKDSQGLIWLGTLSGLYQFNEKNESIYPVSFFHKFTRYRIQDIIETNDGTLFFATKGNGIYTLKDSVVIEINTSNGLLSNTINQLIYDSTKNQVWAGTNQGISMISIQEKRWVPKSIITKYDGLRLTDVRQLAFFNHYLYFANNTGISRIKKSKLELRTPPPIIYFKLFQSNQHEINFNYPISLAYDSNNIQIKYHAISYKSLNNIEYQYKLSPINNSWQRTTNNSIIFNSLPPNNYTLLIKAINVDGVESEIKTIEFNIKPAFWMTIWFRLTILALMSFIGYRIAITSINFYKKQANNQRKLNELQILSLQSKMNPHFIFNSLNSIQNYILKNEKEKANDYLLEFSKLVRIILQNSDSPTIKLSNELDTLQMYVDLEMRRLRHTFKYTTEIAVDINTKDCEIPSLLIQPYVENAIWHGKIYDNPEGEITIKIKRIKNNLEFEIVDNGIGIKNAQKSKIFIPEHTSLGTSVNQKRIKLLGELNNALSNIEIKEAFPGLDPNGFVGTRVIFSIPYVTT